VRAGCAFVSVRNELVKVVMVRRRAACALFPQTARPPFAVLAAVGMG
jgi:hypothetical protein